MKGKLTVQCGRNELIMLFTCGLSIFCERCESNDSLRDDKDNNEEQGTTSALVVGPGVQREAPCRPNHVRVGNSTKRFLAQVCRTFSASTIRLKYNDVLTHKSEKEQTEHCQ